MLLKQNGLPVLLCLLGFLVQTQVLAQFRGTLLDEASDEPLIGACLVVLKNQQGTYPVFTIDRWHRQRLGGQRPQSIHWQPEGFHRH